MFKTEKQRFALIISVWMLGLYAFAVHDAGFVEGTMYFLLTVLLACGITLAALWAARGSR
jgi:uncharacterized membrane protein (DUF485 family)